MKEKQNKACGILLKQTLNQETGGEYSSSIFLQLLYHVRTSKIAVKNQSDGLKTREKREI